MRKPKQRIEHAVRVHNLIAALTIAILAILAVISSGCAAEPAEQSTVGKATAGRVVAKGEYPILMEITPVGNIGKVTDAKGATVLKRVLPAVRQNYSAGGRKYIFGKDQTNKNCVREEAKGVREEAKGWCVPQGTSMFIRIGQQGIEDVYYKSAGRRGDATAPSGMLKQTPGRQISFGESRNNIIGQLRRPPPDVDALFLGIEDCTPPCTCCRGGGLGILDCWCGDQCP